MSRVSGGFGPRSGLQREQQNLTSYERSRAMTITCPICYTRFNRPPCHVARSAVNYCSRGCQAEGRKVRVHTTCIICENDMEQTPSNAARVVTCSKKCSSIRRRNLDRPPRKTSFAAYKKSVNEIIKSGACSHCGVRHGPWAVRGVNVKVSQDGEVYADASTAELWCRNCHLTDIAPLGAAERERKKLGTG